MIEDKYVKVCGPSQVYNKMDSMRTTIRRAENIVEDLENIRAKKQSIKKMMAEEVERMLADLKELYDYLGSKQGKTHVPKEQHIKKPPKTKSKEKTILGSVKIKPKKDAQLEKEKKKLKSSISDLKGELEKLKKELASK